MQKSGRSMSQSASTGDDSTASDSPDLEMTEAPKTVSMVTGIKTSAITRCFT